jgi:glycosyltransferase involved in cell wall biosynthesis
MAISGRECSGLVRSTHMPLTILNVSYPLATVSDETAGGAEQVLAILDEHLVSRGHQSLVIAPAGSCCRGYLLPVNPVVGKLDHQAKQLARSRHRDAIMMALRKYPIDVVHFHGVDFADYLPDADIPAIVTLHLPLDWYPTQSFSHGRETHLVCVSPSQANTFHHAGPIPRVIENGIRLPQKPARHRRPARPYALSLGRICPEKGFHLAMDAARQSGIRYLLAGSLYEYPEHQEYFSSEILPRLNRECRVLSPVGGARKQQLLSAAACVLIPSLVAETSSLVAMEAMASGTPVIAFRAGALCEIVDHGRTGFLVDSVQEMADAMSKVCLIDSDECCREAESRFAARRMVDEYLELYHQVARRVASTIEVTS